MDKISLVAPCGLDCFNCNLYEENLTDEYKAKVAEFRGITPDDVACRGCVREQGACRYAQFGCATWACTQQKGVLYCYECADFPCGLLMPSAKGAAYPHNMKLYNLCRMKLIGVSAWIEESAGIRKRYYEGDFIVGQGPVIKKGDEK